MWEAKYGNWQANEAMMLKRTEPKRQPERKLTSFISEWQWQLHHLH